MHRPHTACLMALSYGLRNMLQDGAEHNFVHTFSRPYILDALELLRQLVGLSSDSPLGTRDESWIK